MNLTPAQRELRRYYGRLDGALVGALSGALLAGNSRGAIAASVGAAVGGRESDYIASRRETYASIAHAEREAEERESMAHAARSRREAAQRESIAHAERSRREAAQRESSALARTAIVSEQVASENEATLPAALQRLSTGAISQQEYQRQVTTARQDLTLIRERVDYSRRVEIAMRQDGIGGEASRIASSRQQMEESARRLQRALGPPLAEEISLAIPAEQTTRDASNASRGRPVLPLADALRPVAVITVLASDDNPLRANRVFGAVLAERGPRAELLCAAMLERYDLVENLRSEPTGLEHRPTYWMVSRRARELEQERDISCPELVKALDHQRAQSAGLTGQVGPMLLGVANAGERTWTMRWDLSAIPPSEFPRVSRIWSDLLTSDPAQWDQRAHWVQMRESARAFLIRFGEPLEGLFGNRSPRAETARPAPRYMIIR